MGLGQVVKTEFNFRVFDTRDELFASACEWVTEKISCAISKHGDAKLSLSGGSTPRPLYQALSTVDLPWESVWATQVDDRITDDKAGSNAAMIADALLQNKAQKIHFELLENRPNKMPRFDLSVLGMGTDGHTASWFPGSKDLEAVLNLYSKEDVQTINAAGCPAAGNYPDRVTLSLPAVMNSVDLLLLITGDEKRRVFEAASKKAVYESPVKALFSAGSRLTVMWAPEIKS